jgi:hypothetical protein
MGPEPEPRKMDPKIARIYAYMWAIFGSIFPGSGSGPIEALKQY